jgi:membrane-associated phospholipid phosphatase
MALLQTFYWLYLQRTPPTSVTFMPDQLLQSDRRLFHLINHDLTNSFFDWVMPMMRNPKFWLPLYLFIIVFCMWRYKKQGAILVAMLLLAVGFADFSSASIIKKQVQRLRPCRDSVTSATVISRVPCGTGYSFPSTHATDHFAIAVFLSCLFHKRWRWVVPAALLWAAVICFAQVYVGVHFPVDVTCGAIYGSLIGWLFSYSFMRIQPQFKP